MEYECNTYRRKIAPKIRLISHVRIDLRGGCEGRPRLARREREKERGASVKYVLGGPSVPEACSPQLTDEAHNKNPGLH